MHQVSGFQNFPDELDLEIKMLFNKSTGLLYNDFMSGIEKEKNAIKMNKNV